MQQQQQQDWWFQTFQDVPVPSTSAFQPTLAPALTTATPASGETSGPADAPALFTSSGYSNETLGGSTSAQTAPAPPAAVPASKRKSFSSCDSCRLRKIKCIRNLEHGACEGCTSKDIVCTFVFKQKMSGKTKRVQQARETYGSTIQAPDKETIVNDISSKDSSPGSNGSGVANAHGFEHIAKAGAGRSGAHVPGLKFQDLSHLFRTFKEEVWLIIPTTNYDRIETVCQDCNYDISQMDTMDRLLCILIAATAARVEAGQAHLDNYMPLILSSVPDTTDILLQQALHIVDTEGILREPSLRGLEALRLLMMLTSGEAASQHRHGNNYRSFQSTYVEHLRILSEEEGRLTPSQKASFFLSHIVNDSFGSAMSGQIPAFTEEDIENYAQFSRTDTNTLVKNIMCAVPGDPTTGYDIIFGPLCLLARNFYRRVSSSTARRRGRVDLPFLREIPDELDRIKYILDVYEKKLVEIFGIAEKVPPQFTRMSSMVRFVFTLNQCLAMDELEAAIIRELSAQIDLQRLQDMQDTFRKLQQNFISHMTNLQSPFKVDGKARSFAVVDGLLGYATMKRLRRLVNCPSFEEAGTEDGLWSAQDKIMALNFFSYISSCLAGYIPAIRADLPTYLQEVNACIAKLIRERSIFSTNTSPTSSDSTPPSQTNPTPSHANQQTMPAAIPQQGDTAYPIFQMPTAPTSWSAAQTNGTTIPSKYPAPSIEEILSWQP